MLIYINAFTGKIGSFFSSITVGPFLAVPAADPSHVEVHEGFRTKGGSTPVTGVSRRVQPLSRDLALPAAKEALKRADRKPEDIDLIVLGTTSPDYSRRARPWFCNINWARGMPAPSM